MPEYLEQVNFSRIDKGKRVRALIRIKCGNMEEENKY